MIAKTLCATLAVSVVALTVWFGGAAGIIYLLAYVLALVPGLPIGWRLFGRTQPAGWVAGALIGYGLTALAFWVPIKVGVPSRLAFVAVWIALTAALWAWGRRPAVPMIALPTWTRRDTAAWLLLLHLVPLLLALPFGRVGEQSSTGTRFYRAYFTADFIWHTALTQEVARFNMPPINPYLAPQSIHYYWAYFVVPAVLAGPEDSPLVSTESALKINATGTALLLLSMVFFAAWSAVPPSLGYGATSGRSSAAAAACAVMLLASSFEGLYELVGLWRTGRPLDALRDLNIDAVTAWRYEGLRIDGLVRSMWYTPQHSTSIALGLVGVLAATALESARRSAPWLAGLALGLSVVMNPFLGAAFCAIYGIAAIVDAARRRSLVSLVAHAAAAVPVVIGLGWCLANRMSEGAGNAVTIGWFFDARHAPIITFVLSFGGIFALAIIGLWPWRALSWTRVVPAIGGLAVGLFMLYFVTITDRAWVGFRAGNVLFVTMPMLAARGLTGLVDAGLARLAAVVVTILLIAGAPTTIIDAFNAQDIENRRMGPLFLWTIPISPAQQAGFQWIKSSTPPDTIVQADPVVRGRQNWSVIPTFAGRRSAAGLPISLLEQPAYARRSGRVHDLLTKMPAAEAHAAARDLGISYLWLDQDDQSTSADTAARLLTRPDLFTAVFQRGEVLIFAVR